MNFLISNFPKSIFLLEFIHIFPFHSFIGNFLSRKGIYDLLLAFKKIYEKHLKNINKSFFGLPGNPISSAACFKFFVYPYLRLILNMKQERPFIAKLKNSYSKKKNFTRFLKSKVVINNKGVLEVKVLKGQESFRIKSFTEANAWALFRSGKSAFKKGELIECFNPLGSK